MKTQFYIINAEGRPLGRLVVNIVEILNLFKLNYIFNINIIIINSSKLFFNINKLMSKKYMTYSGYFGGEKYISLKDLYYKNPNKVIYLAIKNMLPKNKIFKNYIQKNLRFYLRDKFNESFSNQQSIHCN